MAVKITVRPAAGSATVIDVPQSVKNDVEETFKSLTTNPGTEAHLSFKDEDERLVWTKQARHYCSTRPAGALRFRQLPSKNLPANEMRLQITADLEANGNRAGRKN
jgi:hypothetical protein